MKRRPQQHRFLTLGEEPDNDALNEEALPTRCDNTYTWTYASPYAFQVGAFVTQGFLRRMSRDCLELGRC